MLTPDCRALFPFDEKTVYLDHSGFGVTSIEVMQYRRQKMLEIEAAPRAFDFRYPGLWHDIAARTAARFGLRKDDVALVDNVTDGINAVLRPLLPNEGDEILMTSLTYGAIEKAARHIAERGGGAKNRHGRTALIPIRNK